jgi:ubiquinone/menaquinone biosynthesis C-methylase UbiE
MDEEANDVTDLTDVANTRGDITEQHCAVGTLGLALLRGWYVDGDANERLAVAIRTLLDEPGTPLNPAPAGMLAGYAAWSTRYDGDNPMIETEEAVVLPVLDELAAPGVRALDAGCGTGRHASHLAARGCVTIACDQSSDMLDIARAKVLDATFVTARLTDLPFEDDAFDLATVALALCHLTDPTPALAELRRVLRDGGDLVISDPHANGMVVGGQAFFRDGAGRIRWVMNHYHSASTWLRAFRHVGFHVVDCIEPGYSDAHVATNPAARDHPEAARAAVDGLPSLWIWHLR